MENIKVVGQTDREDHLKLGKFLETAEDNMHSRGKKKKNKKGCYEM